MIIVGDRSNQLCNRLSLYRDLMAAAIELNHKLVIPFFEDHASFFTGSCNDLFCRFPSQNPSLWTKPTQFRRKVFRSLVERIVRLLKRREWLANLLGVAMASSDYESTLSGKSSAYDLGSEAFAHLARQNRFIFLSGPLFRVTSKEWVAKHSDQIKLYFQPVPAIHKTVNTVLDKQRQGGSILVGVHIRRGDYADFLNGRYLYSHIQYAVTMNIVRDLLLGQPKPRPILFLLSSNEAIPDEPYSDLPCTKLSGTAVEDLYTLAGCDYLIGPPSTFGKWAAWYGHVPRYTITDPKYRPQLSEFKCSWVRRQGFIPTLDHSPPDAR